MDTVLTSKDDGSAEDDGRASSYYYFVRQYYYYYYFRTGKSFVVDDEVSRGVVYVPTAKNVYSYFQKPAHTDVVRNKTSWSSRFAASTVVTRCFTAPCRPVETLATAPRTRAPGRVRAGGGALLCKSHHTRARPLSGAGRKRTEAAEYGAASARAPRSSGPGGDCKPADCGCSAAVAAQPAEPLTRLPTEPSAPASADTYAAVLPHLRPRMGRYRGTPRRVFPRVHPVSLRHTRPSRRTRARLQLLYVC